MRDARVIGSVTSTSSIPALRGRNSRGAGAEHEGRAEGRPRSWWISSARQGRQSAAQLGRHRFAGISQTTRKCPSAHGSAVSWTKMIVFLYHITGGEGMNQQELVEAVLREVKRVLAERGMGLGTTPAAAPVSSQVRTVAAPVRSVSGSTDFTGKSVVVLKISRAS